MRNPVILYRLITRNITNAPEAYWVILEINTGRIFYNNYSAGDTDFARDVEVKNLIFFFYHTLYQHQNIATLLAHNQNTIPHEEIKTEHDTAPGQELIFTREFLEHKTVLEQFIKPGDSVSFREDTFFEDYKDDLHDFGETISYLDLMDHTLLEDFCMVKSETYYGRYNEGYSKIYQIKSQTSETLSYHHPVVVELGSFLENSCSMKFHDLSIVSIQLSHLVPIFIREHNLLMDKLKELGLYSVNYYTASLT